MITESSRINRYDQLSDELRQRILSGDLKPGDKLPSFAEMRQQYRMSQFTLDRAHSTLESEGLIVRRRGAGTFVLDIAQRNGRLTEGGAPQERPSFLSRAVAVFTPFAKPVEAHKSGGWLEWIGQGAVNAVQSAGCHVVTLHPEIEVEELERLVADRPLGVIVSATLQEGSMPLELVQKLEAAKIPVVVYGSNPYKLHCDCVLSDHEAGAYELTRFLIAQGRRRILNICPEGAWPFWYEERLAGYRRALGEAGLEALEPVALPDEKQLSATQRISLDADLRPRLSELSLQTALRPTSIQVSPEDEKVFRREVKNSAGHLIEFLNDARPVDALMMLTDRKVFLGAAVCRLLGKDPDRDVLITGYDNYSDECEEKLLEPFTPAATVDKNNQLLGATLAQLLFERIEKPLESTPQRRYVAPSLVTPAN